MKTLHVILLVIGLFASGCSTWAWHAKQYTISGAATNSTDVAKVKMILQGVADKSGLKDRPQYASSYGYLAHYQTGIVTLEAASHGNTVWIQLTGGHKASPAYRQAKRLLAPALSAEFGHRLVLLTQ